MTDMKITPVLFVEQIEKSLPFWVVQNVWSSSIINGYPVCAIDS